MARARNIKPSFFQNEELGELQPIARLAFIGMWTIANFKGCIEYRSKRLKVQLLPYDDCDIDKIVNSLEKSGVIRMYSVEGKSYIKIINFEKHQNPHKNERDAGTDIPDFDENAIEINDIQNIEKNREENGTAHADSLILNPDSGFPLTDSYEIDPLFGFEKFWSAYDKKVSRAKAEKEWKRIGVNEDLFRIIMIATMKYVQVTPDKQFRKDPERYLKHRCWNDEIVIPVSRGYESERDRGNRILAQQIQGAVNYDYTIIDINQSDSAIMD